jgi:hypothetical protein
VQNDMETDGLSELLMQRAIGALSAPEAEALTRALSSLPAGEVARWEAAAAELAAAFVEADASAQESMPAALSERIVSTGEAFVRAQPRALPSAPAPVVVASLAPVPRVSALAWSGWFAAAAALLLWLAPPRSRGPEGSLPPMVSTAVQLRDSLLTRDSATQKLAWTATTDSASRGASGDVVWSGRAQRGVMRFAGLQANDRRRWQYQLWIFDKTRDQKYPVDGGVFDVPTGQSEVLVAIDPRVPVGDAVMFAITVEPAGGVVVSTRERIALLAQRGG